MNCTQIGNTVSVIIPTCNRTEYIKRAVSSVINQTYKNIEIVVVDDNLTDSVESKFISNEVSRMDERIIVVKTEGRVGGGKARNIGVGKSTGEYLAFLDDDDVFLSEKIEKQLDFMLEHGYEMSIQDIEWYDQNHKLVEHRSFEFIESDEPEYMLKQHILHHLAPTAIYMIKRDTFLKTGGFGETPMGQDWRLMLSCCKCGIRIGYMPGVYVHQYLHAGERISLGQNKIDGENSLYEIKKKHMYLLNAKEKRYVHFRHYAVLMFGCIRSGNKRAAFPYAVKAFFISPLDCFIEAKRYFGGRQKANV